MSAGAMRGHPLRSGLSMLGIAVGVAAVIMLTSLGEGARRFMVAQFSQFGTNVIAINPGKSETVGIPGAFGGTTQKLTIDDAEALTRLPMVQHVVPLAIGQARVDANDSIPAAELVPRYVRRAEAEALRTSQPYE